MRKEVAKQLVKFFDKKMKQLEGTENKLEPVPDNILKMIDDAKKRELKKTKKKSGGRLSDGTAFIKSLYKDKM
tara:strand:+ start:255 stop:473 length:219 start_codon:yes stop_codon:yes gene_type:complete